MPNTCQKAWYPTWSGSLPAGRWWRPSSRGRRRFAWSANGRRTNGLKAAPGTIRGDYGSSQQMNLVHASDGPEAARARDGNIFPRRGDPRLRADDPPLARGAGRELTTNPYNFPRAWPRESWSIISRVAASTASCQRDGPNRSA